MQRWLNVLPAQCSATPRQGREAVGRGAACCCAIGRYCRSVPSARTIGDVRAVLPAALSNAVHEEFVARKVAELVTSPKQRKRKVMPWSSEEARPFLEPARADGDVRYAAHVLIWF